MPQGLPAGAYPVGPGGRPIVPAGLLRRSHSALTWVSMTLLGVGALLLVILLVLSGGPTALLLTSALAALSFPVLIIVCFWLDRYEPEPARYRIAALGWGGVVAVALSLVIEQALFDLPGTDTFVDTAITAPVVEEFGKGLFLVAVLVLRRSQMHGILDGIVYGALVGIGFAFVEDIAYYLSALDEGALPATVFLRGVMGPFAHPLFTSATGIGIGIAATTRQPALRFLAPIMGYSVAVFIHGIWNGSAFWGGQGFFLAYLVIMLPLLIVVFALAIWARSREGKMLTAALVDIARFGWVQPQEIPWIARLSDRVSARSYAKRIGGRPAARVLQAYQQTMIEIAFLHSRAVNGTPPRDINQRVTALLQYAARLRPYVILPPAAAPPGPPMRSWPPQRLPPPVGQQGPPQAW
jgi:protease PrsW